VRDGETKDLLCRRRRRRRARGFGERPRNHFEGNLLHPWVEAAARREGECGLK